MLGEFDLVGVFLPELLVWMALAYLIQFALNKGLTRIGFYRHVWHRALFDLAFYIVLLGLVVLVSHRLIN